MASTITQPLIQRIGISVPATAEALVAVAAAAIVDIEALQASNSGRDWKDSVRAATAAALAANTRTGNVLLADANGALGAIDTSVTMVVGDRILIKNEVTAANNGLYTVTALGAGGSKFSFTRATDADTSAEVTSGLVVEVEEGTANGGHVFELTTANPITLNSTALTFGVFAPGLVQTTDARLPPTPTAAAKMIYDNGTAYVATAAGTTTQIPVINAGGTAPVFVTMSGDATITAAGALVNTKVNSTSYPAGGALTTGNVPTVTAVGAVTYQAVNLAGGVNYVTGLLPTANQAPGTNAQIAVTNAGATAKVDVSVSGDATMAATGALTVTKVNGSLFQSGVATLTAGDSGAIAATVTANTRIVISLKTANTTTLTTGYAALSGDRSVGAPGSFNIKAVVAAGTINVNDVSTVDWIAFG